MKKKVVIRGTRREQIDRDKLAIAFLMLAKILHEQNDDPSGSGGTFDPAREDPRGPL